MKQSLLLAVTISIVMAKAACAIQSAAGASSTSSTRPMRHSTLNDTNTETYQKCKDSVATVEGEEGCGSGFLCEMDGKKYFVTNRHVARQRGQMTAFFLDGKKMVFSLDSIIEVAANRDLVRLEIKEESNLHFLKLSGVTPNIGERIEFYGNAGGEKVVTVTTGKILAVGQERIEIDCPIQGGNSGSPLVQVSDGCVVGVTTISKFNRIAGDASKVGTRYDPNVKLTREFAVRFSGVKWESMSYGSFLKSVNTYDDLCVFYGWMEKVCLADRQVGVYDYRLPDLKFVGATRLNDFMKMIARSDEKEKKAWDRLVMMREKNKEKDKGSMNRYGEKEFENAWKSYKDKATKAYRTRKEVLAKVVAFCKSTKVLSPEDKEDAIDAFDRQYRVYCEKYRMQLKGVFPRND